MKKYLLIAMLLIGCKAYSQTKDSIPPLTDTTKYLSIRDINTTVEGIKDKITVRQYEDFQMVMSYIINTTSKEWADKHKK